jgi:glutamate-1-semialdehyde 2,1-aminomutase
MLPIPADRSFERSNQLQERLHHLVPGGAHAYARGSDQYPEFMAPVLTNGSGCRVWDADGNEYIEYGMGMRAVTLGHGFRPVVDAVSAAIAKGVNFSRPTELELAAAEDFLGLVAGADMVKFAKNGSDVTTAAVRLARAVTGRLKVAACQQPFFSTDDWFIGSTPMDGGIPESSRQAIVQFRYNDLESLSAVLAANDIACVILEAATATAEPESGYLQGVRQLCDRHGSLLVFDEMITGFRWSPHGAQAVYGVQPDLSCWGKAMANGFSLSALAGRREFMELGGLCTDRERVFLLSTTHGPEAGPLAAFRAVVETYANDDPIGRMERAGRLLVDGVDAAIREHGLTDHVQLAGRPSCLIFITRDAQKNPSPMYRTLFMQELIRRGVLGQSFVTSAAHTDADIEQTIAAVGDALPLYRCAIERGSAEGLIEGRPVAAAIRRFAAPRQIEMPTAAAVQVSAGVSLS